MSCYINKCNPGEIPTKLAIVNVNITLYVSMTKTYYSSIALAKIKL